MPIKISKVIADLNVGRQTIEEFLHKKGIAIDASINARIQDDVYEMLIKEFKPDMDLKSKSEKMASERQKEKAKHSATRESQEIKTVIPGQKPKVVGKIELDAKGNPIVKTEQEPPKVKENTKPTPTPKPAPKAEVPAPEVEPVKEPERPKKEEPAPVADTVASQNNATVEAAPEPMQDTNNPGGAPQRAHRQGRRQQAQAQAHRQGKGRYRTGWQPALATAPGQVARRQQGRSGRQAQ